MQTLLLLAGRSTRFWPLTDKNLFPICGKTILEYQVANLRAAGLKNIILVGGKHNKKKIQTLFPRLPFIEQKNIALGMQGALLSVLPHLKNGPIMVVSGNDIIDPAGYKKLQATAAKKGIDGAILTKKMMQYFPGGYVVCHPELDEGRHRMMVRRAHHDMRIAKIIEKPGEGKQPSDLINIVAHIHHHPDALLHTLKQTKSSHDDGYEMALSTLFKEYTYIPALYKGYWQPIKYPWHLLDLLPVLLKEMMNHKTHAAANRHSQRSGLPAFAKATAGRRTAASRKEFIHSTAFIHPTAAIEGDVMIEKNVRVLAHASIIGPAYIGKGSVIANNALVRCSSIGENCVVGYTTEVARSIFCHGVWTHKNYIGDSVIGENVAFGAGSVMGNFRLDEGIIYSMVKRERLSTQRKKFGGVVGSNSRIGIHVGINPGIKIGEGTFVSGGGFIKEDIEDEKFVSWDQGKLECKKNESGLPKERKFG